MKKKLNSIKSAAFVAAVLSTLNPRLSSALAQGSASPPGVVKSVNGLAGQVSLNAGAGITISPTGNGLTISAQTPPPLSAWNTTGNAGTTAGPDFLGTTDNQPLELKVNGERVLRLEPNINGAPNVIGGASANFVAPGIVGATIGGGGAINTPGLGRTNGVSADFGTIGGGAWNLIETYSVYSTIGGGFRNLIQATDPEAGSGRCTIGGGSENRIETNASASVIGGGIQNIIQTFSGGSTVAGGALNLVGSNAEGATIGGGIDCRIRDNGRYSTISGGFQNVVSGTYSTIGGGSGNAVGAVGATVPGGDDNAALGNFSLAAGLLAKANHHGSFVWADTSGSAFASTANNQFSVRASGGVRVLSDANATVGVQLPAGGNSWAPASDRNLKENFRPANAREVLARVAALSIQIYNLKTQDPAIRHIGPMAQDFQAAFGVGEDDKHISTLDADGVALAAIQGLNQKLEDTVKEKEAEIRQLKSQNESLEQRLEKLEKWMNNGGAK